MRKMKFSVDQCGQQGVLLSCHIDQCGQYREDEMDDALKNIDPKKRDAIINAAIKEFASLPYAMVSTNNIVKSAGISKGLLFHYFGSKKGLYETLIGFVIHTLRDSIFEQIDWDESDFFEKLKQAALARLKISQVYPYMFRFMKTLVINKKADNLDSVFELYNEYGLNLEQVYKDYYTRNVDFSKFRDSTKIPETINIVRWVLEKYTEEKILSISEDDELDLGIKISEMNQYIEILKDAFYY